MTFTTPSPKTIKNNKVTIDSFKQFAKFFCFIYNEKCKKNANKHNVSDKKTKQNNEMMTNIKKKLLMNNTDNTLF